MFGFEWSIVLVIVLVKWALPDAVASVVGRPTSRAADKLVREQAASIEAHRRRLEKLPPAPPLLREAVKARLALWIAPGEQPKRAKPPRPRGPWVRVLVALWAEVRQFVQEAAEESERRTVRRQFDRQNRRRERAGREPIVITVEPCPGCSGVYGFVDGPDQLCPTCTARRAAAAAQQETARPATCEGTHPCAACYQGDWCIDPASAKPAGVPDNEDPGPVPVVEPEPEFWCSQCGAEEVDDGGDLCPSCVADAEAPGETDAPPPVPGPPPAPEPPANPTGQSSHRCYACERNPDGPCPACGEFQDQADDLADGLPPGSAPCPEPAPGPDPEIPAPTGAGDTTPGGEPMKTQHGIPTVPWHNCHGLPGHPPVIDTPGVPCTHCEFDDEVDTPTSAPAATPSHSTTTPGGDPVSQSTDTVINGDVHDPFGAGAFVASAATFITDLGQQAEVCANNMAALGLGANAVAEIRGMQDDAAPFLGTADSAGAKFREHQMAADNIAADEDTSGTVKDTYLDRGRGA